ncbi:GntR family transcriptional regulator [Bombiscardovia nodaiensis]|uniref:GntR family transcriptional regulator n=1 Tax=Bombiscardovia nodaiensis TaxID=2932181 RepID=A0ABM8BAW2_9BIFI|nr:GntR family transcriptional regulator [Bombiscardovia nodaiensis]
MSAGDQLPTEQELCQEYGVSRITLRRAIEDISRDGQVVRSQGRGTFKTESPTASREVISSQIKGFYRQQLDLGRYVHTKVISNEVVRNTPVARVLGIDPSFGIIRLERLRYVNDILQQHVVTYLSLERFPEVLQEDFTSGSLYDFLQSRYGVKLERDEVVVRIEEARGQVAGYFDVHEGTPVLAMDSTVFGSEGEVVCYGIALHPPRHSEIKFIIGNPAVSLDESPKSAQ